MALYGVVIMDVVGSRLVGERGKLQNNIRDYIAQINNKYFDILPAPISITLGDEWQLVTSEPSMCYSFVSEFQQLLWKDNIEMYAGIGVGELTTPIYEDVRSMDGLCFHNARDAMQIVKSTRKERNRYIFSKRNRVYFLAPDQIILNKNTLLEDYVLNEQSKAYEQVAALSEVNDTPCNITAVEIAQIINTMIENNEILKARMTPKQKKIFIDYNRYKSYRNIIEAHENNYIDTLGGISQKMNAAEYFAIQRNNEMISRLFQVYCEIYRRQINQC